MQRGDAQCGIGRPPFRMSYTDNLIDPGGSEARPEIVADADGPLRWTRRSPKLVENRWRDRGLRLCSGFSQSNQSLVLPQRYTSKEESRLHA